jgi:hypothetical protein
LGHHIIATIAVGHLIIGWDADKQVPIWKPETPEILKKAVIDYATEK